MKVHVIFSHGMGLSQDNRGLFPYFEKEFNKVNGEIACHYFDYNIIDKQAKTLEVRPFTEQATILQEQIDTVVTNNPNERVIILGQSQGSLIPAYCNVSSIYKVIGVSPFFHTDMKDVLARYSKSGENEINFTGLTKRKRSDGSTTLMPASYWTERFNSRPEELYNSLALNTKLTLICPLQDEIMDITNLTKIKNSRIINLDGDHDFSGQYRSSLTRYILEEVSC